MLIAEIYNSYLNSLLAGERARCRRIVEELLDSGVELKALYVELFQRSLYNIGELWKCNQITVATEHLATAITEGLLHLCYPALFSGERTGKSAVISCVASEYHQIGGRMVADIFELHGWDGHFLGANTPTADLVDLIGEKRPEVLGLSLSLNSHMPALLQTLEAVTSSFPQQKILVGGQAFCWEDREVVEQYPNVTYVTSLNELERIIVEDGIRE